MSKADVSGLDQYCTNVAQLELLQSIRAIGTVAGAAKAVGITERSAFRRLQTIRRQAANQGFSPDHDMAHTVPDPFRVKGVSTLYGDDGSIKAQWVKSQNDHKLSPEEFAAAIEESFEGFKGAVRPRKAPANCIEDQLTVYPLGDPHIGMYAWAAECGEDFDLTIAREDLIAAMSRLVKVAPKTERCVILNLGDFFHADNYAGVTSRSGHSLDTDSRWPKVLELGCMLMVDLIGMALSKHETVEVINCIGNHDDHSSVMLASFLGAYFHNEPRVICHPTVNKFHFIEFGDCLIGATHGDTVKLTQLGELMATDQPEAWGATEHRYWYTGHIHHTSKQELRGCVVESFRTLAGKDAWHTAQGYRSGRDMYAIVLHKQYGEVERYRCDIRLARDLRE